jgi:hypothetical protein
VLCGIFSTRWVLMALGKEDFGLFGLVGSLVIFLSFFNTQFAGALSRFYAYAVGQAKVAVDSDQALEECRKWFSVGVTIHTLVPLALVAIGYPVGTWAIRTGVVGVPAYRIDACIWLWRFVCLSSFVCFAKLRKIFGMTLQSYYIFRVAPNFQLRFDAILTSKMRFDVAKSTDCSKYHKIFVTKCCKL